MKNVSEMYLNQLDLVEKSWIAAINGTYFSAGEKFKNLHTHFEHKLTNLNLVSMPQTFLRP